jgi:hypothetical protein
VHAVILFLASLFAHPGVVITSAEGAAWNVAFLRQGEAAKLTLVHGDSAAQDKHGRSEAVRWFTLMPIAADYDNFAYCGRHPVADCAQPLDYRRVELTNLRGKTSFASADAGIDLPGTHRLVAVVGDSDLAEVELVVRRDDSYVGMVSELLGVPFVYWPRGSAAGHQTDLRRGADCVALAIYGRRRLGFSVPYVAPPALSRYADVISSAASTGDAISNSTPIAAGDILHFGFQTAVVSSDRGRRGMLDGDDLVIHTYHGVAEEARVSDLPYRRHKLRVMRWRD